MHIAVLILTSVLAVIFAVSGMAKILNAGFAQANAAHLGITTALSRAVGLLEVVAVCGLIIGISVRPASILTAAGIVALMIGAIGYHLRAKDSPSKLAPAVATATIALVLIGAAV